MTAPINPFIGVNADAIEIIGTLLGKVWQQGDEWEHPVCDQWLSNWRDARGDLAFGEWRWWIGEVKGESYALSFATREEAIASAPAAIRNGDLHSEDGRYWIVEACVWNDEVSAADDIAWFARQRNKEVLTIPGASQ